MCRACARVRGAQAPAWQSSGGRAPACGESTLPHPAAICLAGRRAGGRRIGWRMRCAGRAAESARIFDRTEVTRRKAGSRGVELGRRAACVVRARRLVIATGYEADAVLPEKRLVRPTALSRSERAVPGSTAWRRIAASSGRRPRPYTYLRTTPTTAYIGGYDSRFRFRRARPSARRQRSRRSRRVSPVAAPASRSKRRPPGRDVCQHATGCRSSGGIRRSAHVVRALGYGGNGITVHFISGEISPEILGRMIRMRRCWVRAGRPT